MNLLFDHFEKLIEAPDGIQKIRELILQLAVQGKLVPQDPNDEPASELLRKIKAEKLKLISKSKIKKEKPLPPIRLEEIPNKLPKRWHLTNLINILLIMSNGYSGKQNKSKEGLPITRIETIANGKVDVDRIGYAELTERDINKYLIENGDILFSHINSDEHLGKTAIFDMNITLYHGTNLLLLRTKPEIVNPKYINIYLQYLRHSGYFKSIAKHAINQSSINQSALEKVRILLPPLNEQHRIVAKVDQLMSLCGELEKLKEKRDHRQLQMNKAALFALLNSQTPEELAEHWQRIVDHFGEFYHTPENVAELKKAILQLAVQGKLVSQDPNDEPASELLKKIKAEKQKFIVEGKIKKEKPLPPIKPEEIRYELPKGWVSCRLGEVTNYGSSDKIEPKTIKNDTWVLELEDIEKGTSKLLKRITNKYRQSKSTKSIFNKGDVLYGKLRPYLDKVLVAEENGVCTTEILPLRGYIDISPFYLRWYLKSPDFIEYANNSTQGVNLPRLGTEKGRDAIFLLPPFNEQLRIVAKVDKLMRLCDELEKGLTKSRESLGKALGSVVNGMS